MLRTSLLLFNLFCNPTEILNYTDKWIYIDQESLDYGKKRCVQIYPDSPCLIKFIKKEENTYSAICGFEK